MHVPERNRNSFRVRACPQFSRASFKGIVYLMCLWEQLVLNLLAGTVPARCAYG